METNKEHVSPSFFITKLAPVIVFPFLLMAVIFLARSLVIITVSGESMEPTYKDGSICLGTRITGEPVEYGGVYAIDIPDVGLVIKRVVGLPGDTVELRDGLLYCNGEKQELKREGVWDNYCWEVPAGTCVILGDNARESFDSRYLSDPFIALDRVEARIWK